MNNQLLKRTYNTLNSFIIDYDDVSYIQEKIKGMGGVKSNEWLGEKKVIGTFFEMVKFNEELNDFNIEIDIIVEEGFDGSLYIDYLFNSENKYYENIVYGYPGRGERAIDTVIDSYLEEVYFHNDDEEISLSYSEHYNLLNNWFKGLEEKYSKLLNDFFEQIKTK